MRIRWIIAAALAALLSLGSALAESPKWLPASPEKLPRWRGFNLLEKFNVGSGRKPFLEDDFRLISKLGFNFVRLPMDYRCWIKNGDWEQFDEEQLKDIDQAVAFGEQYGIHVCINFHRAPGYTVAKPAEKTSLWTDPETQRVCAKHWAAFAKRYRGISNERVSFNLMNEPAHLEPEVYVPVVRILAEAIRAEDPNRLIISDGLDWGSTPIPELKELRIAQATRGYAPGEISHYKASWVNSAGFPEPQWPRPLGTNGTLLGPKKKEGSHPLILEGPFTEALDLRMRVMVVSMAAQLVVEADGRPVFEKAFRCGPGEGEWKKAEFKQQYNIYQNLFDRDYTAQIPAGTKQIQIRVTDGDWLQIGELGLKPATSGAKEAKLPLRQMFGKQPDAVPCEKDASGQWVFKSAMQGRQWLWDDRIEPWLALERQGVGVVVGEWGAYNKTPHDVFLRWAEDNLANWKKANWGWAMWNFRGSFGLLDSERADVTYEEWEGHKLDRKLLDLLQTY